MRSLKSCTLCIGLFLFLASTVSAHALDTVQLESDLAALSARGDTLLARIEGTTLTALDLNASLGAIETDLAAWRADLEEQYALVAAARQAGETVSLTPDLLALLQGLSDQQAALAQGVLGLAGQVANLAAVTAGTSIVTAAYTILRLSDDIGTMADRILEMADKILVMADNIGIMADRILATQIIQNGNIALVVDATLQTQRNAIALIALFA